MATKWMSKAISGSGGEPPPPGMLGEQSVVLLLYGKNSFGDKIYSYLKLTLANLGRLKSAIQSGQGFNPSDFGEVVAAGKGDPTDALRAEISAMYPVMSTPSPSTQAAPKLNDKKNWDEY